MLRLLCPAWNPREGLLSSGWARTVHAGGAPGEPPGPLLPSLPHTLGLLLNGRSGRLNLLLLLHLLPELALQLFLPQLALVRGIGVAIPGSGQTAAAQENEVAVSAELERPTACCSWWSAHTGLRAQGGKGHASRRGQAGKRGRTRSCCPSPPAPRCAHHLSGSVCKGRSPPVVWGVPEPRSAGSCCILLVPQMVQNLLSLL